VTHLQLPEQRLDPAVVPYHVLLVIACFNQTPSRTTVLLLGDHFDLVFDTST
jgi:hypothetical protein